MLFVCSKRAGWGRPAVCGGSWAGCPYSWRGAGISRAAEPAQTRVKAAGRRTRSWLHPPTLLGGHLVLPTAGNDEGARGSPGASAREASRRQGRRDTPRIFSPSLSVSSAAAVIKSTTGAGGDAAGGGGSLPARALLPWGGSASRPLSPHTTAPRDPSCGRRGGAGRLAPAANLPGRGGRGMSQSRRLRGEGRGAAARPGGRSRGREAEPLPPKRGTQTTSLRRSRGLRGDPVPSRSPPIRRRRQGRW